MRRAAWFLPMCLVLVSVAAFAAQPSQSDFTSAVSCPSCTTTGIRRLPLPYSGAEAWQTKVWDQQNNVLRLVTLSGGSLINNPKPLLAAEAAAKRQIYGKLTPELFNALHVMADTGSIGVTIWSSVRQDNSVVRENVLGKANAPTASALVASANAAVVSATSPITSWFSSNAVPYTGGTRSPLISARLTKAQINQLVALDAVVRVAPLSQPAPLNTAWYTTDDIASARTISVGDGLSACVVDQFSPTDTTYLKMSSTRYPQWTGNHSQACAEIISNTYSLNQTSVSNASIVSTSYDMDVDPHMPGDGLFEYCHDAGTPVINVSMRFVPDTEASSDNIDWYTDWLARSPPFPLYVFAAGNGNNDPDIPTPYVTNKGFNGLAVGATDDKGTESVADDTMACFSSWMNPVLLYGNDYELPHLVAPGMKVFTANLVNIPDTIATRDTCVGPATWLPADLDGTSFSAPQVTATALLVLGEDPNSYNGWPEMLKTTLMATATYNPSSDPPLSHFGSYYGEVAIDRTAGVGLLDAGEAVNLAKPQYLTPAGSSPASRGRWAGTLDLVSNFPPLNGNVSNLVWHAKATATGRMRVVIDWDGTGTGCSYYAGIVPWDYNGGTGSWDFPIYCNGSAEDADLDLLVFNDQNPEGKNCLSGTYNGTYEVCDFPVTVGETYSIYLAMQWANAPKTGFSIAWNNYIVPTAAIPAVPRTGMVGLAILILLTGVLMARGHRRAKVLVAMLLLACLSACGTNTVDNPPVIPGTDASIPGWILDSGLASVRDAPPTPDYPSTAVPDVQVQDSSSSAVDSELGSLVDGGNCPVIGTPGQIASTPRSYPGLELVALKLDGEPLVASQATYDRVVADVTAVGATSNLAPLTPPPGSMGGKTVILTVDSDTYASMQEGAYTAWDCLNNYYGMTAILYQTFTNANTAVVVLKGTYNTDLIAPLYQTLPGVTAVPVSGRTTRNYDSVSYMCAAQTNGVIQYGFMFGEGDCASGCIGIEYDCYESTAAGVVKRVGFAVDGGVDGGQAQCASLFQQLCLNYTPAVPY